MLKPTPAKEDDNTQSTILRQNSGNLRNCRHRIALKTEGSEHGRLADIWKILYPLWPARSRTFPFRLNLGVPKKTDELQPNHTKERPTGVQALSTHTDSNKLLSA